MLGILPLAVTQAATSPGGGESAQFTAPGGHVLGFQPDGVYVAGGDHMLKMEFRDTAGVAPVTHDGLVSGDRASPLVQVTYPHLWEGGSR